MVRMVSGSVMSAMTRSVPPQWGHTAMSISNTRFSGPSHGVAPRSAARSANSWGQSKVPERLFFGALNVRDPIFEPDGFFGPGHCGIG